MMGRLQGPPLVLRGPRPQGKCKGDGVMTSCTCPLPPEAVRLGQAHMWTTLA